MKQMPARPRTLWKFVPLRKTGAAGTLAVLALVFLLTGAGQAFAQTQDFQFTGTFGTDYSNGSYGTSRNTDVELALATLGVQWENFKFAASMPYMRIAGRGLVVFDAAGNPIVINRNPKLAPDVRTGFGDLNLSTTYSIPPAVLDDFEVSITGRIKAPTASTRRRISTGEADFGLSVDVSHQYGIWGPFVTLGYLVPGQPVGYTLYNTVSISAGTSVTLADDLVAVVSYDHDSASAPQVNASQEMFGSLSWIISNSITLTGYGTGGLSIGSPNFGGGLLVSYGFN
jgi:hypothetical protein